MVEDNLIKAEKLWLDAEQAGLAGVIKLEGLGHKGEIKKWFEEHPEFASQRELLEAGSQLVQEKRLTQLGKIGFDGVAIVTDGNRERKLEFFYGRRIER